MKSRIYTTTIVISSLLVFALNAGTVAFVSVITKGECGGRDDKPLIQ